MKLISKISEFEKFKSILPDLEKDEVYFLSLSARNKYLTEEEKEFYSLGRAEMFSRQIAYDKDGIDYALKKLEASLFYKKTRNGKDFPQKSLVIYFNVNPSSTINAFNRFKKEMDAEFEEVYSALSKNLNPNFRSFHRIERKLMNSIQKARSRRFFIDIDFDVKYFELVLDYSKFLARSNIEHHVVETKSGAHILIKKETIKEKNIFSKISELNKIAELNGGEVKINSNAMTPLPGSLQGGKLVRFLNKETEGSPATD